MPFMEFQEERGGIRDFKPPRIQPFGGKMFHIERHDQRRLGSDRRGYHMAILGVDLDLINQMLPSSDERFRKAF